MSKAGRKMKSRFFIHAITFAVILFTLLHLSRPAAVDAGNTLISTLDKTPAPAEKPVSAPAFSLPDIEKRIAAITAAIRKINARTSGPVDTTSANGGPEREDDDLRLSTLKANYEMLRSALIKNETIRNELNTLKDKINRNTGTLSLPDPPYTLTRHDALLGEQTSIKTRIDGIRLAVRAAEKAVEEAGAQLRNSLTEWRNFKESTDSKTAAPSSQDRKQQAIELEKELSEVIHAFEKTNRDNLQQELRLLELQDGYVGRQIQHVRNQLKYNPEDLEQQLNILGQKQQKMELELKTGVDKQEKGEKKWLSVQKNVAKFAGREGEAAGAAYFEAQNAWRKTYQAEIEMIEDMLRLIDQQKSLWRLRYDLLKSPPAADSLDTAQLKTKSALARLLSTIDLQRNYQATDMYQLAALDTKISDKKTASRLKSFLEEHKQALQQLADRRSDYIALLLSTHRTNQLYLNELELLQDNASLLEHVLRFASWLKRIWQLEIWSIDNHPLTVSKLVVALLILFAGLFSIRYIVGYLDSRLAAFTHIPASRLSVIRKLVSYAGYLLIMLFALRMVNIPLGAFAFLGGAIAIGVGFGAQNLINNFISGFIIMGERPINIGDLIDVDGALGMVEEIGARCTRIRTGENIHILVPNSSFLEKNITNWTLGDQRIRAHVAVGVAYGSPVRKVESLLLQSVRENNRVMTSPEPFVIFTDFGDNALIFEVYFWITIHRVIERRQIESNIRFTIDALFAESGIVIAFPQRDVHMDTDKPLSIRLLSETPS